MLKATDVVARAQDVLTVHRVFGAPIERNGLTVIPVARFVAGLLLSESMALAKARKALSFSSGSPTVIRMNVSNPGSRHSRTKTPASAIAAIAGTALAR